MGLQRDGANKTIVTIGDKELFYSYSTLVGIEIRNTGTGMLTRYIQRDGKAGSKTTAKHITQWLAGRTFTVVSESELIKMAEV